MLALQLCFQMISFLTLLSLAICSEDFYKLLGVDKSANDRDLKRAYRTLSKKFHPDKSTGDEKKFMAISEAYETLSDPTTRKIYDQYGHDGLANHKRGGGQGGGGHDPFDLFSRFFGGGGHFGHQQGVRRGPDMEAQLRLPLRDFYNGKEIEFTIEKQQICDGCEGSGSQDGKVEQCSICGGRGMVIQKHMLAPGIFQQMQRPCDSCGGQGKTIKNKCKICSGSKVVRKPITLTASLEKGMAKNHKLVFENEADEHPDHVAGNLNVVLVEDSPPDSPPSQSQDSDPLSRTDGTYFRRKDRDLYHREILSLREAWMGDWSRNLTHLDGHIVPLGRQRGQTVQPGQVDTFPGEGMPVYHDHDPSHHGGHEEGDDELFGRLYVEYVVVIPDQMESGMEKDFWAVWDKWRRKKGVDLLRDSGRPAGPVGGAKARDEL